MAQPSDREAALEPPEASPAESGPTKAPVPLSRQDPSSTDRLFRPLVEQMFAELSTAAAGGQHASDRTTRLMLPRVSSHGVVPVFVERTQRGVLVRFENHSIPVLEGLDAKDLPFDDDIQVSQEDTGHGREWTLRARDVASAKTALVTLMNLLAATEPPEPLLRLSYHAQTEDN